MQSNVLQTLQKQLTPQTLGLVWFSESPLVDRPDPFDELDYFLDGLLGQTVRTASSRDPEHYFIKTTQFSRPFYLIYFGPHQNSTQTKSLIEQDLKLIEKTSQSELLVLGASSHLNKKETAQKFDLNIKDLQLS